MVSRPNTLRVTVDGDIDAFRRAMAGASREVGMFASTTVSSSGSVRASLGSMNAGFVAVTGAVLALGGAATVMQDFVARASSMAESQSKLGVVFGESAAQLRAWAESAAQSMGMSTQAAVEAAGTFGNFTQSLGLSRDEAAQMSPALVQLAADLASFNNASPEETLLALRSGLSGEVEPLRRFGVAINAAAVENAALELGLAKTKDEITEGIKVQARYALIMDQTVTAQGDFARTSDGLANTQRSLAAEIDNLKVSLGESLLPVVLDLTQTLNEMLDLHGDQWAKDFATAVDITSLAVRGLIDRVGDLNEMLAGIGGIAGLAGNALKAMLPPWVAEIQGWAIGKGVEGLMDAGRDAKQAADRDRIGRLPWSGGEGEEAGGFGGPVAAGSPARTGPRLGQVGTDAGAASAALKAFKDAAKEADERLKESFELTEIRNLQLAHKVMEEAELAAAEAIKKQEESLRALTDTQNWAMGVLRSFAQSTSGQSGGLTAGQQAYFDIIANAGGLHTNFPTVDVAIP